MNDPTPPNEEQPWQPAVGVETNDFLQNIVPNESRDGVRDAALSILSKAVPPHHPNGQETGLVIGYVQSGKTMSFETVVALARDNNFQIVIVIAGTSNPLLNQSAGRLRRDLRLDDVRRSRRWVPFVNPMPNDTTIQAIRDVLDERNDPATPDDFKKTVLITVLKNYRRMGHLTTLINRLGAHGIAALIIDDEADQASLNNEAPQGQQSTTYRCLMDLKRSLPNHTYLQYTATPQAPLLISIIDSLSPNFVQVLEPGSQYVGGIHFFHDRPELVQVIPPQDVPSNTNPLAEPPESLIEALRVFMVGIAIGLYTDRGAGNRSMLVHPSHLTLHHREYYDWVRNAFEEWKRVLELPAVDADRQELLQDLREAYDDLAATVGSSIPAFADIAPSFLMAFRNTRVLEVNAAGGQTPAVDWTGCYGWILVGGQAMDRGFTVEGLTVTYMPRGIGVGNADTVQQRARFFGYKRGYLGYCRVYLEAGTLSAFQHYVEHEEDIRGQLLTFQETGTPLNEWKRAFVMDLALRPCRNSVLEFDFVQGRFSDDWVFPDVVQDTDEVLDGNRAVVRDFIAELELADDEGHPDRTEFQRHHVCRNVPLRDVMEALLIRMRLTGATDSQNNTGMLLQLSKALEANPQEVCTVYQMSRGTQRERSVDGSGKIGQLFQGAAPVAPPERRGEVYPGDRAKNDGDTITVQLHSLNLKRRDDIINRDVAVVAVWVPARLEVDWLVQDQPPQN